MFLFCFSRTLNIFASSFNYTHQLQTIKILKLFNFVSETMERGESREGHCLRTPERNPSRSGGDRSRRSCSRNGSWNRGRSTSIRQREQHLERERERLRKLERTLQEERDLEARSRRSEQNQHAMDRRQRRLHVDSEHREHLGDGDRRDDKRRKDRRSRDVSTGHRSRSCSPLYSSRDIIKIIHSLKNNPTSQPSEQNTHSVNKLDYKNILPEFDPSNKNQRMDVWLRKVNECASVYGWDDKTIIHFSMQKLQGLAKVWYQSLNTILFTWPEWQEKLIKAFPSEQNYGQSLEDMLRRRSKYNEPIENYYYEKLALINQCEIIGKRAVDCIIHGLSDRTVKSSALALRCNEPDQLLQFLLSNKEHPYQSNFRNKNATENLLNENSRGGNSKLNMHSSGLFCYNCKERGHLYIKCTKPLLKCDHCHKIGHKIDNCRAKQEGQSIKPTTVHKTMCITSSHPNDKFTKQVLVNGKFLDAFIDFGSEVTLIRETAAIDLGVVHNGIPSAMKGFGNGLVQSLGSATLTLSIDGVAATVSCKVVNDQLLDRTMLVGQSYSEQPHIIVIKDSAKLRFLDVGIENSFDCFEDAKRTIRVRVIGFARLYGIASVRAATEFALSGNIFLQTKIVGKLNEQFVVLGGIYEVKKGYLSVIVTPCSIPCLLQKNFIFSRAEEVDLVRRVTAVSPVTTDCEGETISKIDRQQIKIGESVTDQDKEKLFQLLRRFKHCFASDLTELGCTDVTEMQIELNSDRPVVYRPYRLSHQEREKVRDMVDDMLDAGVIRESISNYASPIILVRKRDGKVRMCIDYRMLNSITVKERYPMPIIDDEVSRLAGQAWFITLDLMSGYYQVPIVEHHKHLTAFVTPDGQYEFNRVPFGLANAPAVFQRMMNRVLGPMRFNGATVYIDDVLVYGRNADEALTRLEEVLQLLDNANLKLNLAKCSFLENQIEYLGYEISSTGMRPGIAKIRSVSDFPRPENVHTVRQFLGLVSYFRKFIQGFAELASPLTKLLKKDVKWEWEGEQEKAFEELKTKLVSRPVLAIYDYSAETELHTDASRVGIGGILLQRTQGSTEPLKPVAYFSRQTTPEEKNFHSYELETLAVVCALRKFRVFLLGKEFKIITDCSALRSTFQKRDLIPRIARWWLALQEFNCTVEYRAGTKMTHADALSRNPVNDKQTASIDQYSTILAISNEDWLLTLQMGDSELCRIRDIINSNLNSKGLEYIKDNYLIKENKLFRILEGNNSNIRWVVPKGARWQVCKMNHDDIGHVGGEKTLERIKRLYWFPKMSRFVKKYVKSCIDCAYAKATTNNEGLLHPIVKNGIPFHTLHTDHLGPFIKSKKGNTHILVTVDSFTKFVFIKPVRNTKTQNVIRVLEDIFDTFRNPDRIISDRGSCFTSHAFRRFCMDRGVKHILNAVASPRSNGQVERYNRTILDSLTAQNLRDDEKNWDIQLGKIQWGLNNTLQKTIGRTPAEVMFGTIINSESNPILNEIGNLTRESCDLSSLRREVKNKIDREQEKQKQYYDKGRRPAHIYKKGELVKIVKTAFQNAGKSTKLLPTYEGPYKVVKVMENDRYKVAPIPGFEGMKNKRKTTVASDRMRPWIHITSLDLDSDEVDIMEIDINSSDVDE